MSTPPTPHLPEQNPPPPPTHGRSSLAKLAIAFAVTIVVAFGLCSVTLMHSTSAISGPILPAAVIIEAICVVGLIVVAILAIARRNKPN
jgi:FtsH-binding integral membrane protein